MVQENNIEKAMNLTTDWHDGHKLRQDGCEINIECETKIFWSS